MRTGTFLCWLFGHKFIAYGKPDSDGFALEFPIDYCTRCGIRR